MKQLEDYYRYLDDFKKNNKNKNFKKSFVTCPYCGLSSIKGNSLKYHMTITHKNIEDKYNKLGKYFESNIRKNSNDVDTNDVTKMNNNENHILQYIAKNNDNQISKNNNVINNNLNDMKEKKKRTINSKNYEDFYEKKFNLSNSMDISNLSKKSDYIKNKGDNNREYHGIESSFDFKEKNIEDEDKNNLPDFHPEIYTFKHELPTNNGKIIEEFIINGNKIISNLNKEETQKRIYREMCKICNYFIEYKKYDFTHKEILTKSDKNTNNKTFILKKRQKLEEYGDLEKVRKTLKNLKDHGYFNFK